MSRQHVSVFRLCIKGQLEYTEHSCTPDKGFRNYTGASNSYLTHPIPSRGEIKIENFHVFDIHRLDVMVLHCAGLRH